MLNLTELNKTIEKRKEEKEQEAKEATFKQFLLIKEQVEAGIKSIAEDGKRSGIITIYPDFELISSFYMEKEITRHYCPIDIRFDKSFMDDNLKPCFTLHVFIPSVEGNSNFGLGITK